MKFFYTVIIVGLCSLFMACTSNNCTNKGVVGINITNIPSSTDSFFQVVRYQQGSSFGRPVDSFKAYNYGGYYYRDGTLNIPFYSYTAADYGDYDMKITMLPSGRVHRVTNIWHENNKGKAGFSCLNPIHYQVDSTKGSLGAVNGRDGFEIGVEY